MLPSCVLLTSIVQTEPCGVLEEVGLGPTSVTVPSLRQLKNAHQKDKISSDWFSQFTLDLCVDEVVR